MKWGWWDGMKLPDTGSSTPSISAIVVIIRLVLVAFLIGAVHNIHFGGVWSVNPSRAT